MDSESIDVVDVSFRKLALLWLLALSGLAVPTLVKEYLPGFTWADQAARSHHTSMRVEAWHGAWEPINQDTFSTGWIRCERLEDALALDQKIDDGNLISGQLVLAEGGMAWLPE
jgi:hypothetical protein